MQPTTRVQLRTAAAVHEYWTKVEITRDLADLSGAFLLDLHDLARARRAIPGQAPALMPPALDAGAAVQLSIDGELVLDGYVDDTKVQWTEDRLSFQVAGRDRAGDLVDCAASVTGPVEYRGLTLLDLVGRIAAPFGIPVRADVDTGAALPVFSIDAAETALSAIEKACRQRAVLCVSDGIGGLVLTRGGARRGPSHLKLPGNVQQAVTSRSWRERHSAYVVKGQSRPPRAGAPALSATAAPLSADTPAGSRPVQAQERVAVVQQGLALDAEITRHRPLVTLAKTQSGGSSVQTQAEWMLRVARGKSDTLTYTLPDWRAGPARRLWRPNELVMVDDAIAGIFGDMLVAAVTYRHDERGSVTELRLAGPEAFDLVPEGQDTRRATRRRRDANRAAPRPGNATASALTAETPSR